MSRPRLLDLFAGAGGAGEGYRRAGFDVVEVDVIDHGAHPPGTEFIQADAFDVLDDAAFVASFAAIHASPPCLDHTSLKSIAGTTGTGWMLAETLRRVAAFGGMPYVVENVAGAKAAMPGALKLCGSEFRLGALCRDGTWRQLQRHRLFVSNVFLLGAGGCSHTRAPVIGV